MSPRAWTIFLLAVAIAVCGGCTDKPAPPEVPLALRQEQDLLGAGALSGFPVEYATYEGELSAAKALWQQEQQRLRWLRDDEAISAAFRHVLTTGDELATAMSGRRLSEGKALDRRRQSLQKQVSVLRDLSAALKDRRLASRRLVQVEIRLSEIDRLLGAGEQEEAENRLAEAESDLRVVVAAQKPVLERFADRKQIARWITQFDEAMAASRRSGSDLIVVQKVERTLTIYRKGKKWARYSVGLGSNGLSDKRHAGDKATPEGNYRVERKLPNSKYFRALLIDYPNAADRQNFRQARRDGLLKNNAAIGGLIEIHGGGSLGITDGCVALDNHAMALLYEQIAVGTPVLIIGTIDHDNLIASALRQLP
ncbi:hypothetical protein DSOUD_1146 [Desulfuromonas soudanensis]|uniref:L,D-TPase catalytic domain-containing protein n=1 Tax=Desulfuromonas soudanensis TaxID=1603606 RepID=A0A0M4CVT6_9BACT|nr:L,D-transpeptidase family protein [Desulfuromonas soudanensis]ALC15928.1 hypothetical protein DSOUD_1146 [Desulfuromonas soudanensis]